MRVIVVMGMVVGAVLWVRVLLGGVGSLMEIMCGFRCGCVVL